jgi:hypothetical protein
MSCCFPRLSSPSTGVPEDGARFPSGPRSPFVAPASSRLFFGVRLLAAALSALCRGRASARLFFSSLATRHSPLLNGAGGCRGQTKGFPYSESLQSLRVKRSISHGLQKTSRLERVKKLIWAIFRVIQNVSRHCKGRSYAFSTTNFRAPI